MAGRDLRIALALEATVGAAVAYGLHGTGWDGSDALLAVLCLALGLRALVVLGSYVVLLQRSSPVPPGLQVGPLGLLRMALQEFAALLLLFVVVQPFERLFMPPDHLRPLPTGPGQRLPVLLLHGYTCNRGFWLWQRRRLESAGWVVATHSLEPALADIESYLPALTRRIDEVLAATGATQLILVGHSMGGLVSRAWFRQHGCAKVARFISLGSPHQGSLMARIAIGRNGTQMHPGNPWLLDLAHSTALPADSLSIYSVHDNQVIPQRESSTLDGARLLSIGGVSHLGMAFSNQVTQLLLRVLED